MYLEVELIAREGEYSETAIHVLLNHGIKVGVLLGVGCKHFLTWQFSTVAAPICDVMF